MNKQKQILFNLNNFLLAMSIVLDKVEANVNNTIPNHLKRVAYLSLKIGEKFNLANEQLSDLCAYALVHSNALYLVEDDTKTYCEVGQSNIETMPFLTGEKNIIKYHKELYDGSGVFGLKRDEIPLFSQIIGFADLIDTRFDLSNPSIENRTEICHFIKENQEKLFSLDLSEIFCDELSIDNYFWLDFQYEQQLLTYIFKTIHDYSKPLLFEEILSITLPFSNMVHDTSKLISLVSVMAEYYSMEHKDKQTLLIATSMCRIGKLALSKEYQTKQSLDNIEYENMKSYIYFSKMVLDNIMGFSDISSWASKVQERVDGTGYPYSLEANHLSFKDRLLSSIVVYESLINKQYKEQKTHNEAIEIMYELASFGRLDGAIIQDIQKVLS